MRFAAKAVPQWRRHFRGVATGAGSIGLRRGQLKVVLHLFGNALLQCVIYREWPGPEGLRKRLRT